MAGVRAGRGALWRGVAKAAAVAAFAGAALAADAPATRVPMPGVSAPAEGKCVEDTAFMRRNHMRLLVHQRDRTVHEGIRTERHSLANCVSCHASREAGRVTGSKEAFCEGCHRYAAVRLDCFECHADRPSRTASAAANPGGPK
ncbi:MAG: hypothetical protein HS109_18135 [Burkholderiales bacterium]|nr:hypothetical protein [Burkholderiales bacterium]